MDDKLLNKIDQLLAQMQQSISEIRAALPIVTDDLTGEKVKSVGLLREALKVQVRAATAQFAPLQFMSGRWRRRSGDVYGNVQGPPIVQSEADADSQTGHIRPPDQR